MHDNTEMPTIEFGDGTDYDSLFTLLWSLNERTSALFAFHIEGGGVVNGRYCTNDEDDMVIALYSESRPSVEEYATVDTDLIEKLVYL